MQTAWVGETATYKSNLLCVFDRFRHSLSPIYLAKGAHLAVMAAAPQNSPPLPAQPPGLAGLPAHLHAQAQAAWNITAQPAQGVFDQVLLAIQNANVNNGAMRFNTFWQHLQNLAALWNGNGKQACSRLAPLGNLLNYSPIISLFRIQGLLRTRVAVAIALQPNPNAVQQAGSNANILVMSRESRPELDPLRVVLENLVYGRRFQACFNTQFDTICAVHM